MKLIFSDQAWEDYLWWQSDGNAKGLERVNTLVLATRRT
ncbi:MAG: addiction module protein, partial [Rhodobacterales bacterium 17-64-5]